MFSAVAVDELTVFQEFVDTFPVAGRNVLEVGGSIPWERVAQEKPALWVMVDPVNEAIDQGIYQGIQGIASSVPYPNNSFDYVFSCNAFEHISDLEETLAELKRLLKPNGVIFSHFGPIWSAPDGHHLDIVHNDCSYNFWEKTILPHWYHLIFSPEELSEILESALEPELVQAIIQHVYLSDWINRRHYEDYLRAFEQSGLTLEYLAVTNEVDYPEEFPAYRHPLLEGLTKDVIQAKVEELHGKRFRNLFCRDMKVVLRNY
ncbi:hypothetical protein CBW65_04375 [Tumebacillus avium]|uniref:Methyltransferase type 11 domain-containing protein n=1 Tax=Tumebacillus avium TaxID=1903704 RepID=A0A1Y0IKN2_9BACL|nr:class I SAM-dependent methyltransferase [Tumebacillus avium]ARU60386.1 hypothetical protein CBW65_04375 [Tumebacillus avium]